MKGIVIKTKLRFANAITLFPFIITKKLDVTLLNHERIHLRQQFEMLIIPFYVWYVIEWFIRGANDKAYRNVSFERESYDNENNLDYLKKRNPYSWIKYLKKKL